MAKNIRNLQGQEMQDQSALDNLQHNNAAGSKKVSEVGRNLLPIAIQSGGVVSYTTDATTARRLDFAGKNLAVYNNSGSLGSITLGSTSSAPTVLVSGVTDANGNVGIPCAPNAWTYIACDKNYWVIASAATLLTFIINDFSSIKPETAV